VDQDGESGVGCGVGPLGVYCVAVRRAADEFTGRGIADVDGLLAVRVDETAIDEVLIDDLHADSFAFPAVRCSAPRRWSGLSVCEVVPGHVAGVGDAREGVEEAVLQAAVNDPPPFRGAFSSRSCHRPV
jgi:hypothetical protein